MGDSNKNKIEALRLAILFVLLLLSYVFLTTPFTFFKAASPDFLMIFVIGVALFENPLVAGVFGFLGGLLKDISSTSILGFNAFVYLVWAVLISVSIALLIRKNFINSLAVCGVSCLALKSFYYFIYNVLFEKGGRIALFYRSVLPSTFLSLLVFPLTYYVLLFINKKFSKID